MRQRLLYVNGRLVDLNDKTVVAKTLQAFDLAQLGSVKVNFTNSFKIEKTDNNKEIFEHSDSIKSQTDIPYTSLSVRYSEDGQEIIPVGDMVLKETDTDYSVNIYEGPFGFFDFIATKKLWDLDFSDLNSNWNNAAREGYRNTTTGIVCALVNDGQLSLAGSVIDVSSPVGNVSPQIYYHTVIEKIFTSAGYTFEGAIFSDDAYLKLVMPLRMRYNSTFSEAKRFIAYAPGTQILVDPAVLTNITFDTNVQQGSDNFYDGVDEFVADNPDSSLTYFYASFKALITITVTGGTVDLKMDNVGVGGGSSTQGNLGSGTYEFSSGVAPIGFADGDLIRMQVVKNTGTPTVTITSGLFYSVPSTGVVESGTWYNIGTYVYFNLLFDDFLQTDLLKDFSTRFGIQMTERNGVIVCKTLNDLIADKANMIDWTNKRVGKSENVKFDFGGMARTNYFSYPGDSFTSDLSSDFARGLFTISNENLPEFKTLVNSVFSMSDMSIVFDSYMLNMDLDYSGSGFYNREVGKKLFYVRSRYTEERQAQYNASPVSDYLVGYFTDSRQTLSCHWQFFIDRYYTSFIEQLQKAKKVKRPYDLSVVDIISFDHTRLVYDDTDIFIATKINNFINGEVTEVELFKIN